MNEPSKIQLVAPSIASNAPSSSQKTAPGMMSPSQKRKTIRRLQTKPSQMTPRAVRNPYTSVRMSLMM